jgi:site-specific DNA-methyltransferase (adenine-specific)
VSLEPYYADASVTIYHGRCEEIIPRLDLEGLACIVADPPYGIGVQRPNGSIGMSPGTKQRTAYLRSRGMVTMPARGYPSICEGDDGPYTLPEPLRGLLSVPSIYWGANHYSTELPAAPGWFIWDKREGQTSDNFADAELAWTNLATPARLFSHYWRGLIRRSEQGSRIHPMQKPVALMKWCLSLAKLEPGSLILDPYTGSGPVLRAAKDMGLRAIGIDSAEWCCDLAAERLRQTVLDLEAGAVLHPEAAR